MPEFKVMSWNLRTFAVRAKHQDELQVILDVIKDADIVGIQEVYTSEPATAGVRFEDREPSQRANEAIRNLVDALNRSDGGAQWQYAISNANASGHLDHYAFLYKHSPQASAHWGTSNPANSILITPRAASPLIEIMRLDVFGGPNRPTDWKTRRPGRAIFSIDNTPVRIYIHHACIPTNVFREKSTGRQGAIQSTQLLTEILELRQAQRAIVLGDFNCDMNHSEGVLAYDRLLLEGYFPITAMSSRGPRLAVAEMHKDMRRHLSRTVQDFTGRGLPTTLRDPATVQNSDDIYASSYDHIFFKGLTGISGGRVDVIQDVLSNRLSLILRLFNYVGIFSFEEILGRYFYARQNAEGISDHVPVFGLFSI